MLIFPRQNIMNFKPSKKNSMDITMDMPDNLYNEYERTSLLSSLFAAAKYGFEWRENVIYEISNSKY